MSYRRVYISATIELISALHIGSGEEEALSARVLRAHNANRAEPFVDWASCKKQLKVEEPKGRYARTYRQGNLAAIAASSFRGLWRRATADPFVVKRYFGPVTDERAHLVAGCLRIHDLSVLPVGLENATRNLPLGENGTGVTQGIRINPITGTVVENFLWAYEYVPPGVRFKLHAEVVPPEGQSVQDAELSTLLCGLLQVGATADLALGHATTKGFGLLKVVEADFKGLDDALMAKWLINGGDLRKLARAHSVAAEQPDKTAKAVTLDLHFPYGLLAGEPRLSSAKTRGTDPAAQRGSAQTASQQYARDASGKPMIRGSSLKGLLRAHCEKILATAVAAQCATTTSAAAAAATDHSGKALQALFGDTNRRSALSFTTARWLKSDSADPAKVEQWRTFVAIDRFTGGAADEKLYDALAASSCTLRCEISASRTLQPWEIGLLLHALRDALDGDLAIGWGKSKGLGRFRLAAVSADKVSIEGAPALRNWAQESSASRTALLAFDVLVSELATEAQTSSDENTARKGFR